MKKRNDPEIFDLPEGIELLEKFNLKRLVEGRGHDGDGLVADLCIKSKKLLEFNDNGWGGEPEIRFLDDKSENLVKNTLKNANCAEIMLKCGWNYIGRSKDIDFETQIDFLVGALATYKDIQKIMKLTKKWIICGTRHQYRYYSWKNVKDLAQVSKGSLQQALFQAQLKLKDGEKIWNTKEQLISLGVPENRL